MKEDKDPINLVLLRWYDGVNGEEEMYGCPKLCLTDQYTQCWYGTMSKENFNVLDMSWTLSRTCPVQVSHPNIPLYSVIIKDSN